MAATITESRLNEALAQCIGEVGYPEGDAVITAELPSSALTGLGELFERAREDVKASIRELSKLTAPDVDGWISQAKLLRTDIDDSKRLASDIKHYSEEAQRLQSGVKDAASKVDLLNNELSFNEALTTNLDQVYELQRKIKTMEDASFEDDLEGPIKILRVAREQLSILRDVQDSKITGLLEEKISALTKLTDGAVIERWESCFEVDMTRLSNYSIQCFPQGNIVSDLNPNRFLRSSLVESPLLYAD